MCSTCAWPWGWVGKAFCLLAGDVGAVEQAVGAGAAAAAAQGLLVRQVVIPGVAPEVLRHVAVGKGSRFTVQGWKDSRSSVAGGVRRGENDMAENEAMGFVETRGLVAAIEAADAMVKAARGAHQDRR